MTDPPVWTREELGAARQLAENHFRTSRHTDAGETTRVRAYVPGEFGTVHLDYNTTLVRVTRYERGIARQALTIPGDRWQDGIPASEFLLAALADGRIADVFAPELPHDLTSPLIGEAMS